MLFTYLYRKIYNSYTNINIPHISMVVIAVIFILFFKLEFVDDYASYRKLYSNLYLVGGNCIRIF